MTKIISLFILALIASSCEASEPKSPARFNSTEVVSPIEHDDDFSNWIAVYKGSDAFSGEECYLYVKELKLNPENEIVATVATSYKEELYTIYQQGQRLVTRDQANGELLRINYHSHEDLDLHFESFNFKMLHVDHFHNESCEDLAPTEDFPDLGDHDHDHGHGHH